MKILVKAGAELPAFFSAQAATILKRMIYVSDRKKGVIEADSEREAKQLVKLLKKSGYNNAKVVKKRSFFDFLFGN